MSHVQTVLTMPIQHFPCHGSIYGRVYFVSYKKWRVKATTETLFFQKKTTHKQNPYENRVGQFMEKVSVGFRLVDLEHTCEI